MPPPAIRYAYQLHLQLQGVTPVVWRRLWILDSTSLAHLHRIVQAAFGWHQPLPFYFDIAGQRYGQPSPDEPNDPTMDARRYTLGQLQQHGPVPMLHVCGAQGAWTLRARIEAVAPAATAPVVPDCIEGRHCPDGSQFNLGDARLRVQALQAVPRQKVAELV